MTINQPAYVSYNSPNFRNDSHIIKSNFRVDVHYITFE